MVTFIVEGWSDHDAIKRAYPQDSVTTVVLNGTKFNNGVKAQIEKAMEEGDTYLLSDPDVAGDQIEGVICGWYNNLERIRPDPTKARFLRLGKGYKYGIEYCSVAYLKELLGRYIND